MKPMNIIYTSDDNGVEMLLVSLYSVAKHNTKANLNFYIIHNRITQRSQNAIKKLANNFKNVQKVKFLRVDPRIFDDIILENDNYPVETYYKYLAQAELPDQAKALYIDIDILCVDRLNSLYDLDITRYYLAGVKDYPLTRAKENYWIEAKGTLGFADNQYFNAGMMLMNLERMRKDDVLQHFLDTCQKRRQLIPRKLDIWGDQTLANIAFRGGVKFVSERYDLMTMMAQYAGKIDAVLVHYAGRYKPMTYRDKFALQYDDKYLEYYLETQQLVGLHDFDWKLLAKTLKLLGRESTLGEQNTAQLQARLVELDRLLNLTQKSLTTALEADNRLHSIIDSRAWRIAKPLRKSYVKLRTLKIRINKY